MYNYAVTEKWTRLKPDGDVPPSLEEHTMVSYGNKIFVFGGISRMSVDGETPLWILDTCEFKCYYGIVSGLNVNALME